MDGIDAQAPHVATMDVCLAGVFIGKGDKIPDDLYDQWQRRLAKMGLEDARRSQEPRR